MNAMSWTATMLLIAGSALAAAQAPRDDGPILYPKKQVAKPAPASATLLVVCDLACNWKLDGVAQGRIETGGSAKNKVELGQHVAAASTEDGLDKVESETEIKAAGQTIMHLALQPVRDARLKAEQDARDKAAREQTAREQAAQELAKRQFKQGQDLYDRKSYDQARPLFQSACDDGILAACVGLGNLDLEGNKEIARAAQLFQKGCDGGEMLGCDRLGYLHSFGRDGIAMDWNLSVALYTRACNGGESMGCIDLANAYWSGEGVAADRPRAIAMLTKECQSGSIEGCDWLGEHYEFDQKKPDYASARPLYEKACDAGYLTSCISLAWFYWEGHGVPRDRARGKALMQKACDGGEQAACGDMKKMR